MTDDRVSAIREAFDARAGDYDENAMHRALAASVARFARVPADGTVVDAATGTGLVARALLTRCPGLHITGVDISPGMLAVARTAEPRIDWVEADAATLPLDDASVDLVTCVTALHLFAEPDRAIEEWARVLRPGGRVVAATFVSGGHHGKNHAEHSPARHPADVPYPRDHASFATPERLQAHYAPTGLRIDRLATWVRADDRLLIAEAVRV
ncbi:methyltransferase domain-containing protein [Microbacterium horticulturae]|uniref:Methyltransferase domain-containing protein n=1 Tax=Microbacterium horticulturae TaxID=3028316 RepID=A0ABY8C1I6_9MICO|nr:methyltransferase domain-containing protein [Microbacterium sp. KACC 23027]WEG10311.1 methyltransferase domain-containing protein [Microbacterium sp. KACC 23027]